jgi:hypothetical protein
VSLDTGLKIKLDIVSYYDTVLLLDTILFEQPPNGLRYLRWGGDGEAVQPEKS